MDSPEGQRVIPGAVSGAEALPVSFDLHLPPGAGPFPVILIQHGFKGFKDWGFFPWLADRLAEEGWAALRFNTSHNGVGLGDDASDFTRPELFARNRPSFERADLQALLDALRRGGEEIPRVADLDREKIGLLGHSRGGYNVILAGLEPGVRAVVTWASVASCVPGGDAARSFSEKGYWDVANARTGQVIRMTRDWWDEVRPLPPSLDARGLLPGIGDRLLLVHGDADTSVPLSQADLLHEASQGRARKVVISGADHVFGARHPFLGPTPQLEEAVRASVDHFTSHLS